MLTTSSCLSCAIVQQSRIFVERSFEIMQRVFEQARHTQETLTCTGHAALERSYSVFVVGSSEDSSVTYKIYVFVYNYPVCCSAYSE